MFCRWALLAVLIAPSLAAAGEGRDPPVPPGRDPGGTQVAIVGGGIDYTKEGMAERLARDGEGEIIGYDFADDDRRPYPTDTSGEAEDQSQIVLGEGQATTLVILRFNSADALSLGKALRYAGQSPAKVILLAAPLDGEQNFVMVASGARYFRDRLFVVPAGDEAGDMDQRLPKQGRDVENLILVAASDVAGVRAPNSNFGATTVDLFADGTPTSGPNAASVNSTEAPNTSRAAARIAALAARALAVEPFIRGAALKARITGLAKQSATETQSRYGVIAQPWRHFWLE